MNTTQPTIFIVDDDPAMRDSLSWLIETIGYPVKVFASAQEFLDGYQKCEPGCLVLDVRLPGMSGIQLQQRMKIVFLEKPFRDQELLDNIQEALEIDATNRKKDEASKEVLSCVESLTQREKEVMELMVKGNPSKEIAKQCGISVKTIEIHRARVMDKMQANSLPELVHMVLNLQAS